MLLQALLLVTNQAESVKLKGLLTAFHSFVQCCHFLHSPVPLCTEPGQTDQIIKIALIRSKLSLRRVLRNPGLRRFHLFQLCSKSPCSAVSHEFHTQPTPHSVNIIYYFKQKYIAEYIGYMTKKRTSTNRRIFQQNSIA